jgi:hypothetical protein
MSEHRKKRFPHRILLREETMPQEKSMKRTIGRTVALPVFALALVLGATGSGQAQDTKTPYPTMAAPEQYLMADRDAEISLARSAAPESISRDAEVMVLGTHGYETAVRGTNGFVCLVQRSWTAGIDDPDFWNPRLRAPICFNPPAVRSYLPLTIKKTDLVLAGQSKARMSESIRSGFEKKALPALEAGSMCYMMSKDGYLNDRDAHWHPHVMFFVPQTDAGTWDANLPGSPILAATDASDRLTIFLIPVANWSDGTADHEGVH